MIPLSTMKVDSTEQQADTAEIYHCCRSCRNGTEYNVRPPTRLQLRFLIIVSHLLEGLKYRSKEFLLPQCLRLILVSFFVRVYSRTLNLTKSIHKAMGLSKGFTEQGAKSAQAHKGKINNFSLAQVNFSSI